MIYSKHHVMKANVMVEDKYFNSIDSSDEESVTVKLSRAVKRWQVLEMWMSGTVKNNVMARDQVQLAHRYLDNSYVGSCWYKWSR